MWLTWVMLNLTPQSWQFALLSKKQPVKDVTQEQNTLLMYGTHRCSGGIQKQARTSMSTQKKQQQVSRATGNSFKLMHTLMDIASAAARGALQHSCKPSQPCDSRLNTSACISILLCCECWLHLSHKRAAGNPSVAQSWEKRFTSASGAASVPRLGSAQPRCLLKQLQRCGIASVSKGISIYIAVKLH